MAIHLRAPKARLLNNASVGEFFSEPRRNIFGSPVFGAPLDPASKEVPPALVFIVSYIESKVLTVPGMLQSPPKWDEVLQYTGKMELGEITDHSEIQNPRVAMEILKIYLKDLPEPLLTYELYEPLMAINEVIADASGTGVICTCAHQHRLSFRSGDPAASWVPQGSTAYITIRQSARGVLSGQLLFLAFESRRDDQDQPHESWRHFWALLPAAAPRVTCRWLFHCRCGVASLGVDRTRGSAPAESGRLSGGIGAAELTAVAARQPRLAATEDKVERSVRVHPPRQAENTCDYPSQDHRY